MNYAWIENNVIRDIAHSTPSEIYHPDIAVHYDTLVPDEAAPGDTYDRLTLTKQVIIPVEAPPTPQPVFVPPTVTVIEWKMLFHSEERIAITSSVDPVIVDLQSLMNDPRTTHVVLSLKSIDIALDYMTLKGYIADGRKAEILTGKVL